MDSSADAPSAQPPIRDWIRRHRRLDRAYRTTVGTVGGTVLAAGIVMMPLPGPGAVVALAGLGVLSTEFPWARRVADGTQKVARTVATKVSEERRKRAK